MENFKSIFEQRVLAALPPLREGDRVGIALSGGADSVALLAVLKSLGVNTIALHCNFNLRGEESNGDEKFCRELCRSLGVEIHCVDFETRGLRQSDESIEMACRRLRYEWFEQQFNALKLSCVAIAHHREDCFETMFINLLRGTGPRGLRGIDPRREIYVRPLLDFSREEIEKYLAERGLEYRTDSSNLTNDYRRNVLRNSILPLIRESFPTADAGLSNTMDAMRHASALIDNFIKLARLNYVEGDGIDVVRLNNETDDPFATLYLLAPQIFGEDLSKQTVTDILAADSADSRLFIGSRGSRFELYRGWLRPFFAPSDEAYRFNIRDGIDSPLRIEARIISYEEFVVMDKSAKSGRLFFDADSPALRMTAELRHWQPGDRIKPFGMKGVRKLSDIFSDMHLSASEKNRAWVVTLGGEIVWLPGIRASRLFLVTDAARRVLMLSV